MNLTGMLDTLNRLSDELEATKQEMRAELNAAKLRQLETEKELNTTREILKIGTDLFDNNNAFQ